MAESSRSGSILHDGAEVIVLHAESQLMGEENAVGLVEIALQEHNYMKPMDLGLSRGFSSIILTTDCQRVGENPIMYGRDIIKACRELRESSSMTAL